MVRANGAGAFLWVILLLLAHTALAGMGSNLGGYGTNFPPAVLTGQVTDGTDPINGATVSTIAGHSATTDTAGNYTLYLDAPGIYTVTASTGTNSSTQQSEVSLGSTVTLDFQVIAGSGKSPIVTTTAVSSITSNNASSGGNVISDGGASVTARGVCWSTSANPTISNSHTTDGTGIGTFTSSITGLSPGTSYHVRAYATNSAGTGYGSNISFVTSLVAPSTTTNSATSVTAASAILNGTVNPNGSNTTYYFEYGTTTSYGSTTSSTSAGSGTSVLSVSSGITGLSLNTTYHYRIVAANSVGISYGTDMTFATASPPPTVTTNSATSVMSTSATLNGTVNPNGLSADYYFEFGATTSYGSTTSSAPAGSGTSAIPVNTAVSELTPDTTYHYRLVATNGEGTSYGDDKTFSTVILYVESSGSCGVNIPCYLTIQEAIDAATSGATIKIAEGIYDEDLIIDTSNNITLQGGWNSTFTDQSATSSINSMTINDGTITVDELIFIHAE